MIPALLGNFAAPSRLRRNWMFIAVATPAALTAMVYMYRNSLQRMLEAFIKDTKPNLSEAEVKEMAGSGDMSVVSREYERSIINAWKNFVAGDIVRMVQFIKRELLIATTAIGQLARENELNLRMMATVPAFLLAWGSFRAVRPVYYWLKSEESRESTFAAMRTIVLAMERLLNLRHREGTW
ncbi:unnamed protein product [Hapterophycus canaliculatus]